MRASPRQKPERLSWALAGTLIVSAVAFWRPSLDIFGYPKFAALVFGVAIAAAIAAHNAVTTGRLHMPWGPPAWAATAFASFVLLVFVLRPSALAFIGAYSRHTGALFYVSVVLAALLMMRVGSEGNAPRWVTTRTFVLGVVIAGGLVGLYGIVQLIGADPFTWVGHGEAIAATFGNNNFTAALVGATVPAAAWAAWDRAHDPALRITGGLTLVAVLATAMGTRSVQGPVTAGVGLLVFSLAVLLGIGEDRVRRGAVGVWVALTVAGGALGSASLLGRGPFGGLADAATVDLRSFYWSAGLRMFADNPLTGVGLERYGAYFGEFRGEEAAARLGLHTSVDSAHNVPIQLFATGGLLVGLAYVGFVALTAVALVGAFRRTSGHERLLVGALGGIWASYQAQSLVSIDTPPLALLHWLSAGAIVAWSGMVELRTFELSWFSSRRKVDIRRRRQISGAVLAVGLVVLFVLMLAPLRAGTAAARGSALAAAERYPEALQELDEAMSQAGWDPVYWNQLGDIALRARQLELAMDAYQEALEREPRSIIALVTAARIAVAQGEEEQAAQLYERALEVEPLAPTLLEEAASFFENQTDEARAGELRLRADRVTG